jgi:hypothetical protein
MALLSVRRIVSSRERITSSRWMGESCDCCAAATRRTRAGSAPSMSAAVRIDKTKLR